MRVARSGLLEPSPKDEEPIGFSTTSRLAAETIGTFFLVFAGAGAIIVNDISQGAVTHPGIALTFGLVVFAMISTFGEVSGAHFNPAVTLGLTLAGRFSLPAVVPYILAQLFGACLASGAHRVLFPNHRSLGLTAPSGSDLQSFAFEMILTGILMLVILRVSTGAKEKGITAGLAIGAVIGLEAMFAGPICGASMNPARSLAPALVAQQTDKLWIYLTAPILGAVLAVPAAWLTNPVKAK